MELMLILTFLLVAASFTADAGKTVNGAAKGLKMFLVILPSFIVVIIFVSVFLYFFPEETLAETLGKNAGPAGFFTAALLGSVSLIPGFIAYPLSGIMIQNGVSYKIIAVFITTLMMVGVFTFPLESKYFGWKAALTRNALSFTGAMLIGFIMGLFL